jgi:hypothetical protein
MALTTFVLAAAVVSSGSAALTAADFFPLNPGDEYTYIDDAGRQKWTIIDRVAGPVKVGDREAFRVDSYLGGKVFGSSFYVQDAKEVVVAAYEADKPLPVPLPIFKLPGGTNSWEFEGPTTMITMEVNTRLQGSVKNIKPVKVLGKDREALEVKLVVFDGTVQTEQTSIYAKGIGLVEMKEVTQMNKTKQQRVRRLISYRPAQVKTGS